MPVAQAAQTIAQAIPEEDDEMESTAMVNLARQLSQHMQALSTAAQDGKVSVARL